MFVKVCDFEITLIYDTKMLNLYNILVPFSISRTISIFSEKSIPQCSMMDFYSFSDNARGPRSGTERKGSWQKIA
jgi:hypothetical protein